ncbi:MAG: hypothetical protein Q8O67_33435 [Deltaproteobacteria bacterium]|nr:hypothetical protein [Deltaproteobacteria bacterium]
MRLSRGTAASETSFLRSVSDDGRFAIMVSLRTDLVPGALPIECLQWDRRDLSVTRAAVDRLGRPLSIENCANDATGRFVVFTTASADVVVGDTNGERDVFLHDRELLTTVRVSVGDDEGESPAGGSASAVFQSVVSRDGRFVVFQTTQPLGANDVDTDPDLYVRDALLGETRRLSEIAGAAAPGFLAEVAGRFIGDDVFVIANASGVLPGATAGEGSKPYRVDVVAGTWELLLPTGTPSGPDDPVLGPDDTVERVSVSANGDVVVLSGFRLGGDLENYVFVSRGGGAFVSEPTPAGALDLEVGVISPDGLQLALRTRRDDNTVDLWIRADPGDELVSPGTAIAGTAVHNVVQSDVGPFYDSTRNDHPGADADDDDNRDVFVQLR